MKSAYLLIGLLVLNGCTALKQDQATTPSIDGPVTAKELSTGVAGSYVKKRVKLSINNHRDAYALMFLAGDTGSTVTARPTVLMTLPYEGFDWSEDATDRRWSTNVGAAAGYVADDQDSTGWVSGATGSVQYQLKSENDLYGDALFYLLHGMNVAFVFNRFYAGGTFTEHAFDTAVVLRYLSTLPTVNPERIGMYGLSWGGMTAAYGAAMSGVPVKQLTLLSPVLDPVALATHFTDWVPANVVSSSQRNLFTTFFVPYGRRIFPVTTTARASDALVAPLIDPNRLAARLAERVERTLVMADDWDTLVKTSVTRAVVAAMPSASVGALWWSHADTLSYETAPLGHNVHPINPLVFSDVLTITQLDMAYALLPPAQNMTVLIYDVNEWNHYLNYMRGEQQRGQDTTAFTRMLIQMSEPRVTIQNQADPTQTATGAYWVSLWLQNYWGVMIPTSQVLTTLQATGLPLLDGIRLNAIEFGFVEDAAGGVE